MNRPMVWLAPLVLLVVAAPLSNAFGGNPPAGNAAFTADDFDWRDTMPYLLTAAGLPEDEGLKTILENSKPLRIYVAGEVRADCELGNDRCDSGRKDYSQDSEVTRRIDGIIREGLRHQHKSAFVDFAFGPRPFVFSQILALRSDKRQDAYLVLQFADNAYTAAQVQAKYGAPFDTDIFGRSSVYKYRVVNARYAGRAVFEIDPVDGAVMKVAISVKVKRRQRHSM
ncbi:MAG TPA: hypothetical protein VMD99_07030 [Terriglobales bacterium]|nr:hypothetical protein [Terriglobales bacterium]